MPSTPVRLLSKGADLVILKLLESQNSTYLSGWVSHQHQTAATPSLSSKILHRYLGEAIVEGKT